MQNRRGTTIRFGPTRDLRRPRISARPASTGSAAPRRTCSAACTIRWACDPALLEGATTSRPRPCCTSRAACATAWTTTSATPRALSRALGRRGRPAGRADGRDRPGRNGRSPGSSAARRSLHSYCNTVPTPQGGTHEAGFRNALLKGLRGWGEQRANKRAAQVTAEDLLGAVAAKLSAFVREPQFQGQTKEKLTSPEATRLVETALRDRFDHWLAGHPAQADTLLAASSSAPRTGCAAASRRTPAARSATRRLRLPGKLADCTREGRPRPRSSWSRATAPAARPSRRATARPRRCCRCGARS